MKNLILSIITLFSAQACLTGLPVFADTQNSIKIINDLSNQLTSDEKAAVSTVEKFDFDDLFEHTVLPIQSIDDTDSLDFGRMLSSPMMKVSVRHNFCINTIKSALFRLEVRNLSKVIVMAVVVDENYLYDISLKGNDNIYCTSEKKQNRDITFNLKNELSTAGVTLDDVQKKKLVLVNQANSNFVLNTNTINELICKQKATHCTGR